MVGTEACFRFCSSVQQGILAYDRTKAYFYAYYITKTLTAMVSEGSMQSLSLAYVVSQLISPNCIAPDMFRWMHRTMLQPLSAPES